MKNIDLFNDYTAAVLAQLYLSFPVKTAIDARKLCGHMDHDDFGFVVDPMGQPSRAFEVAMSTVDWLSENGFIVIGTRTSIGFSQVVLTPKGLEILRSTPEALRSKEPMGDRLVRYVREGSAELAREVAKVALTQIIGG